MAAIFSRANCRRDIQTYGPSGGYVYIEGIQHKPKHIRIVHGDTTAKNGLAEVYKGLLPNATIGIGTSKDIQTKYDVESRT